MLRLRFYIVTGLMVLFFPHIAGLYNTTISIITYIVTSGYI